MTIALYATILATPDIAAQIEATTRRARPIGNSGDWITSDDYPKGALRDGAEGKTGFILDIGPNGRVTDCNVTHGSGNDGLDAAACALLRDRGRFTPATDRRGKPIPDTYASSVSWQIPRGEPMPLRSMQVQIAFDVDGSGHATHCAVVGSAEAEKIRTELCRTLVSQALFVPAADRNGKPVVRHVVSRLSVEVTDAPGGSAN